jgi:hypothetical protein
MSSRFISLVLLGMLTICIGGISSVQAQDLTVGLYAPTVPFAGTSARVESASRLADHIGKSLSRPAVGKVYARAGDFAAAVKKGEVTVALVDVAYLAHASVGSYSVVGVSTRGGDAARSWQVVSKGGASLAQLRGKKLLLPNIGGRESDFVYAAMFAGELPTGYFGSVEAAPDSVSALAAVGLGKADAALIPGGMTLPAGVSVSATLALAADAVLVVWGDATLRTAVAAAVGSYKGEGAVSGLRTADADVVKALARRFVVPQKRGLLLVPSPRVLVGDLLEGRTFSITAPKLTTLVEVPDVTKIE